jgi:hypothetical protein
MAAQGMVEFALVGGIFFFVLFSTVNAGLFLYDRNSISYAADVGIAAIAAEGNCAAYAAGTTCVQPPAGCPASNADDVGICRMDAAGLTSQPLLTVTEIDIWRETAGSNTCNSTGSGSGGNQPCNDSTCDTSQDGPGTGTAPCEDSYTATGTQVGNDNWPPKIRNVNQSTAPDFARLVVTYTYTFAGTNASFHLTDSTVFRLEPQQ